MTKKRDRRIIRINAKDVYFNRIIYRDLKGKRVKFSPRKKLKVELYLSIDGNVKKSRYSLPYAKRKNPSSPKSFRKQIEKGVLEKSKYIPLEVKIEGRSVLIHYKADVEEVEDDFEPDFFEGDEGYKEHVKEREEARLKELESLDERIRKLEERLRKVKSYKKTLKQRMKEDRSKRKKPRKKT